MLHFGKFFELGARRTGKRAWRTALITIACLALIGISSPVLAEGPTDAPTQADATSKAASTDPTDAAKPKDETEPPVTEPDVAKTSSENSSTDPADAELAGKSADAAPAAKAPDAAAAAVEPPVVALVPTPGAGQAVITVKVGGDRSNVGLTDVTALQGVVLALYADNNDTIGARVSDAWATCTSDAAGDCSFVIPDTQRAGGVNGANRDKRFWVKQVSAPTGWRMNANLATGGTTSSNAYQFQTGVQLRAGQTYKSTENFMSTNSGTTQSSGVWQNSRNNPSLPPKCGLDVAMVMDLSGSVGSSIGALKGAADTFVDSLTGTPSRMSVFSFAADSPASGGGNAPNLVSVATPAGATAVKNTYQGWTTGGATNWDQALSTVADATARYDVVVVITDGNPTVWGSDGAGAGNTTYFRYVEHGIFGANKIKAEGSRVVAVGVGAGVTNAATALNLSAISGPTANSDYYQSDTYQAAGNALKALALGNCNGTLTVVKQIVPSSNTGNNTANSTKGSGWSMSATTGTSGVGGLPATKSTDTDTGSANFPLTFSGGVSSASVTVTETQQTDYVLVQKDSTGQNAVCTNINTGANVIPSNVGGVGAANPGFTVSVPATQAVTCTIYNKKVPKGDVTVEKKWVVNGVAYDNGDQPAGISAQLTLTGPGAAGASNQSWGVSRSGYTIGNTTTVNETTSLPTGCTVGSRKITEVNGATTNTDLPAAGYTLNVSQAVTTATITNTITCPVQLQIEKRDKDTGNLVTISGARFKLSPDPRTGAAGSSATVTDGSAIGGVNTIADDDGVVNGLVRFDSAKAGTYTIEEISPPAGYALPVGSERTMTAVVLVPGTAGKAVFSFADTKLWAAPTVTKDAKATYDAKYTWTIKKEAAPLVGNTVGTYVDDLAEQQLVGGTDARFRYRITASQGTETKSNFKVTQDTTGIRISNTNAGTMRVTLSDATLGVDCTFPGSGDADPDADGVQIDVPGNDHVDIDYTCALGNSPTSTTGGTNTATVKWSKADYPQNQADVDAGTAAGTGTATGSATYSFVRDGATDETINVTDDKHQFATTEVDGGTVANGVWTINWGTKTTYTATYDVTVPAKDMAGKCSAIAVNTAKATTTDTSTVTQDQARTRVCWGADLSVIKNKTASLTRSYLWDIDKTTSTPNLFTNAAGAATASYTVKVKRGAGDGYQDSGWAMSGFITVANPNDWQPVTMTSLTDVYEGVTCAVNGTRAVGATTWGALDLTLPASTTREFRYSCTFTAKPAYTGTNTATANWNKTTANTPNASAVGTAAVVEADWSKTLKNKSITVTDTRDANGDGTTETVTLGTVDWDDATASYNDAPHKATFTYTVDLSGTAAGVCKTYPNTATIKETAQSDDASVKACNPKGLTASKTGNGTFDREYKWKLDKDVDKTKITTDNASATFNYTVTATPDTRVDNNWQAKGSVTVTNPNTDATMPAISFTATEVPNLGAGVTCTWDNYPAAADRVLASGASKIVDYTCTGEPTDYTTGTNKAKVDWTVVGTGAPTGSSDSNSQKITYTENTANAKNRYVDVKDDKTNPAAPVMLATNVDWQNADGAKHAPYVYNYPVTKTAALGTCASYTNNAAILGATPVARTAGFLEALIAPATLPTASKTVTHCNRAPLGISKTVTATKARTYNWLLSKGANTKVVEIAEGGSHNATYTVTATPNGFTDNGYSMSGTIKVWNPNSSDIGAITGTVIDVPSAPVNATCTVTGGTAKSIPAGTTEATAVPLTYSCTMNAGAHADGTNKATVTWDKAVPADGTLSANTGDVPVTFAPTGDVNKTITVTDPMYDDGEGGHTLGTATWQAQPAPPTAPVSFPFTYTKNLSGTAGKCTTYDNTATITETKQTASESVKVCVEKKLTVSKTADTSFKRLYKWKLDKVVDPASAEITDGGKATFGYDVTATPDGFTDSDWAMSGKITVTNPNTYTLAADGVAGQITADITDAANIGGGVTCTVTGGTGVVIAPDTTVRDIPYSCTFTSKPDYTDGTNTATATWTKPGGGSTTATGTATTNFTNPVETNKTVDITDDKTTGTQAALFSATWNGAIDADGVLTNAGTATKKSYEVEVVGVVNKCTEYKNVARITQTQQQATATVTVCRQGDLTYANVPKTSFARTFDWTVAKDVDKTKVTVDNNGTATFNYTVTATPGAFTDSGWTLTGTLSVSNPNAYKAVTVAPTLTSTLGGGAACTLNAGQNLTIPASGSENYAYTCTFTGKPAYSGNVKADITWNGGSGSITTPVTFANPTLSKDKVDVRDDKTSGTTPGELLGQATWNGVIDAAGAQTTAPTKTEFTYALSTLTAPAGKCQTYTNTAGLYEPTAPNPTKLVNIFALAAPTAVAGPVTKDVTVCNRKDLTIDKTVTASFGRTYHWTFDKSVDETVVEVAPDGSGAFTYTVKATPNGYTDASYAMSGTINVTNPNTSDIPTISGTVVDVPGVGGGAVCTVTGDGAVAVPAGATVPVTYSCTFTGAPAQTGGTNKATVSWAPASGTTNLSASSADKPVTFANNGLDTNKQITITDKLGDAAAGVVATFNWPADGTTAQEKSYDHEFPAGTAGQCATHTNNAWITQDAAQKDSQDVKVCVEKPLEVSKTGTATFKRSYDWDVTKSADQTDVELTADGKAKINYTVTAVPGAFTDSAWTVTGKITVTNPNTYSTGADGVSSDIAATVTDSMPGDPTCTVEDGGVTTVVHGTPVELDYECTFASKPDYTDLTNTATATWDAPGGDSATDGSAVGTKVVNFTNPTETNKKVDVYDDKVTLTTPEKIGEATWDGVIDADGNQTTAPTDQDFAYKLELDAPKGKCAPAYVNHATIPAIDGAEAEASVTICRQGGLTIVDVPKASYDREFDWSLAKQVDQTMFQAEAGTKVTANYTVTATPGDFTDSGWESTGTTTITNTNDYKAITLTDVTVESTLGSPTCALDPGQEMTIPKSETKVFTYTCTYASAPPVNADGTYAAGKVTVTYTWDKGSATLASPVTFASDVLVDETVEVIDDQTVPGTTKVLGSVTWAPGSEPVDFTYPLELAVDSGVNPKCMTYTNTAVTAAPAGEEPPVLRSAVQFFRQAEPASATTEVCPTVTEPPVDPPTPSNPPKAGPKSGTNVLPSTGGPRWIWLPAAGSMMMAGFVLMASDRRRRRNS